MKMFSVVLSLILICSSVSSVATSPGFQVLNEVSPGSMFEKLGMRQGDRIISFDGKAVSSVQDSMDLYSKLNTKAVKTVVIERDGKKQTLTYPVR